MSEEIHETKYCPLCGKLAIFRPYGIKERENALCPNCGSLERHRLVYLYLKNETDLFSKQSKMLHIAPEPAFQDIFNRMANIEYISADLNSAKAMVEMNIESIDYEDDRFDVIYCSHVLEHVQDDHKAIRELHRVLNPNGWALIQVPLKFNSEKTLEDSKINTPELRKKHYGQEDHLRYYGLDFKDRLENGGFDVESINYSDVLNPSLVELFALPERNMIYFCRK